MSGAQYTIRGGHADADRLERQASVMAQATGAFLVDVGVRPGLACLDVGCGDGQVSIQLARAVGPTGRVVGLDSDPGALEIARRAAEQAGIAVTFVDGDAATAVDHEAFDIAVARLVLSHLVDPMAVVRAMRAALRPGGALAVEDVFAPTLHAEPPVPALDRLVEVYCATVRSHGGDPTIGPRLAAHLRAAGLADVRERTVVNRMPSVRQKLFIAELLDNMREAVLTSGAATADELDDLRAVVRAAAERPDTVFFQARMHQVFGRVSHPRRCSR
jgi:ubiquinone/menaquinone biosynthesis C-methylase UbiE